MTSRLQRLFAAAFLVAVPVTAQDSVPIISPAPLRVPFGVGERLEYNVKFGILPVGSGSMEVSEVDTIRGREAWHTVFRVSGGMPMLRVNDLYESWLDATTLTSLRYLEDKHEGGYKRKRRFEIFPDRREYTEDNDAPLPSVADPLDDASFLYFIRTIPLEVGKKYTFDRYFRPDRNPVQIEVLRKESIQVPAGKFDAVVIRPVINARGIFSEDGRAEVWLSDDANRIILQLKSKLSIGSLNLYLKSYRPPPHAAR
jgi:hypothetical protein